MWKQFSWFFPNYWKKSGAFTGYISSPNLFCKECVENIKENWNVYNVKDLKMWSVTRIIYALSSVVVAEFSFYWCIRTWLCYVLQAVLLLQNECQKLSSLKITLSLRSREMNKRSKGGLAARVIWLYQLSWKCKLATVTSYEADVSSVSPSSERMEGLWVVCGFI